jgi:hypothetical protein
MHEPWKSEPVSLTSYGSGCELSTQDRALNILFPGGLPLGLLRHGRRVHPFLRTTSFTDNLRTENNAPDARNLIYTIRRHLYKCPEGMLLSLLNICLNLSMRIVFIECHVRRRRRRRDRAVQQAGTESCLAHPTGPWLLHQLALLVKAKDPAHIMVFWPPTSQWMPPSPRIAANIY